MKSHKQKTQSVTQKLRDNLHRFFFLDRELFLFIDSDVMVAAYRGGIIADLERLSVEV